VKKGFDLLILGSGSTAFAAAIRAAELGNSTAMTEMRTLGGTCVNQGCLPNNTLIDTAQDAHSPIYFGITFQDWDPEAERPPSVNPLIRNNLVF